MLVAQHDPAFSVEHQQQLQRQLADKISNYASIDEIRLLLITGAQPNQPVVHGLTPLHYACFINYFAAAKLLLAKGAQVDAVDEVGCSALHLCAEHGYYRMIKLLLEYMETVRQYEAPKIPEGTRYPSRETVDEPLRLAIQNGHYECARLLLEKGASPNTIYFDGPEITHVSALDVNFIELLLSFGANPNVFDRKGLTPMMRACRFKNNGIEAIKLFIKYGADVNLHALESQDKRTALHYACLSGSIQLVKFLIENGAQVNMEKEFDKPSPLDMAVLKDDPEMIQVLLDASVNINAVHSAIGSALHLAACSTLVNKREVVRTLLENKADPNMQHVYPDGASLKSPFVEYFKSTDKVDPQIVALFLAYGARVIMRAPLHDRRGQLRNVLRLTATRETPEVLESLLSLAEEFDTMAIDRLPLPQILKGDILKRARNPSSLQQLCRLQLRSTLTPFTPSIVHALPLSPTLRLYLLGLIC